MSQSSNAAKKPSFIAPLAAALAFCAALAGCSGGSSPNTGNGTQTPDLGTLVTLSDSSQYKLENVASSLVLGIAGQSQTAGASLAQESDSASPDALWHFIPMNNSQYNVENMLTHQVAGIQNASTTAGAQALQWADNGTGDHLWKFYLLKDGNYLIQNVKSSLYLEDAGSNVTSSATIDQGARATAGAGCTCQEWALTSTTTAPYPDPISVNVAYSAPDSATIGIHDPSLLKAGSSYVLFSTHGFLHAHASTDRINFSDDGYALSSLPLWANAYTGSSGDLWAPDASMHHGEYWLYYAASSFGSAGSAIGLATSPSGEPGTFTDSGAPIYTSANCAGSNAIDPASVTDASGNAWLAFGSWSSGIQIVPVDNTTGIPTGAACTQIAFHPTGTGIEGSTIYPHGGYYYLFASIDDCCQGVTSTYRIIVGRSSSITGPYTDRGGIALTEGGGTILLSAHGNINGPGGQGVLADTDGDILIYHYYDGNNNGDPALGINHLAWTADGWPYVQ
ncbi:MAG TPA: family 43 glycosylhydrolase [Candidatus Sulfopaludibacter sp.]|nr:family 43 glycosylhydrolase [Candidatus Sulfopaludibacter sp.]